MVPQLSCGYYHTAVITEDGAVYTFGRNDYGQLGLGHKLHMARPTVCLDFLLGSCPSAVDWFSVYMLW